MPATFTSTARPARAPDVFPVGLGLGLVGLVGFGSTRVLVAPGVVFVTTGTVNVELGLVGAVVETETDTETLDALLGGAAEGEDEKGPVVIGGEGRMEGKGTIEDPAEADDPDADEPGAVVSTLETGLDEERKELKLPDAGDALDELLGGGMLSDVGRPDEIDRLLESDAVCEIDSDVELAIPAQSEFNAASPVCSSIDEQFFNMHACAAGMNAGAGHAHVRSSPPHPAPCAASVAQTAAHAFRPMAWASAPKPSAAPRCPEDRQDQMARKSERSNHG
ncbi:hypothetical protein OBBRIDRAFT_797681 [Obba rivulosa]|uniref:Uncharacterized protein n=1 Tax=Obba rivulosa TaxID=1052685 RepID=A0A8E2AJZ6_9APHY|nr:hypothetical protein OBBRIDRAFT_797681 [Obba rivulosa]